MNTGTTSLPLGGIDISYRDSGPTEHPVPVLLVHGMGGDGRTWDRFARTLRGEGRRVLTMDLRGHGRSAKATSYRFEEFGSDVAEVCDELGIERVDLVGHSLGGHAIGLVARERPDLVRRLVIEEAPLPLRDGSDTHDETPRRPTPQELWHATTSLLRSPRALFAFDRAMTGPALEQFHTPDPEWWERLSSIESDVLFLRGGPTGMVDPQRLEHFTQALPRTRVVSFTCGHSIHRDRYREFEKVVVPFLMRPDGR
ncbi:alpha/beta hydrolase [Rhodococcus sp. HNM0569]|uniref:alpha/beta fold hydrolase n=1 Tax=Rhodococcus sp. HNM0569 TaxID=2716340 RepID=UPI00146E438A|nr:alpha/beta fold hydrolase [Rhodococcus sp. HNM0569]